MTGMAWYSVIVTGLIVAGGTYLAVVHVIKVARWVAKTIAEARDNAIAELPDPVDAQLDTNPVVQRDEDLISAMEQIMDSPEGQEYTESLHFDAWQAEVDGDPGIRKYSRRMDRRSL